LHKLKHIINGVVWTVVFLYFAIIAAVHLPFVQSWLGEKVSHAIGHKLGTQAYVSRIDIGFLNRIIIDGVVIYDQNGRKMLQASRIAAKLDYYELICNRRIFISSAQLFGMNGSFYQKDAETKANYQFALDSLASKDTTKHNTIELSVNSLIIRHGSFSFNRYDVARTCDRFNLAHLRVKDISAHLIIPYFGKDSLITEVKKLSLQEQSGLYLRNLTFRMEAGQSGAKIENFELKTQHSALYIRTLNTKHNIFNGLLDHDAMRFNGEIGESTLLLADISPLVPELKTFTTPLSLSAVFSGTSNSLRITHVNINTNDHSLKLAANGSLTDIKHLKWSVNIKDFACDLGLMENMLCKPDGSKQNFPNVIRRIGHMEYKGTLSGNRDVIEADGSIVTDIGRAVLKAKKKKNEVSASVIAHDIDLQKMTENKRFGIVDANISGSAVLADKGDIPTNIVLDGAVNRFDYNGYSYKNITMNGSLNHGTFNGNVSMDDPNGFLSIEGAVNTNVKNRGADITATIRRLNPTMLKLTDKWDESTFNLDLQAKINISDSGTPTGSLHIGDFTMMSSKDSYHIEHVDLNAEEGSLLLDGDFGHVALTGRYDIKSLPASITAMLHSKLHTLFTKSAEADNAYVIKGEITSAEALKKLLNIPLTLHAPLSLKANVNDKAGRLDLECNSKGFSYGDSSYENFFIKSFTRNDTLHALVQTDKVMGNGHRLGLSLEAGAADDKLNTNIRWNNHRKKPLVGMLCAETTFTHSKNSNPDVSIKVKPSSVMVSDTIWNVLPAKIEYSDGNLSVDNFAIEHNRQHIKINGVATRSRNDSITVDLQDVDVSYILNLVNFHAVDFSGLATGKAFIKSVFFEPDAYADLKVDNFKFENGRMGELQAHVNWNKEDKQIDIAAVTTDDEDGHALINGYVSPARNQIDLGIRVKNANLECMENFCGSFIGDINARGIGHLRVVGPLSRINLTGTMVADGTAFVKPLSVTYTLKNDTIRFIPDNIIFSADTIIDRNGNIGVIDGTLHHEHLTHLTYDLRITAQHLLCYDTHSYGEEVFYGTAYGSGLCTIKGGNGRIDIDVDVKPEKNSFIEYNAASPEAISSQEYITWHDATPESTPMLTDSATAGNVPPMLHDTLVADDESKKVSIPSDLRINFNIDVTPEATLRVLMDKASGDYIALNGTGSIRATYFNKGAFNMFGTYLIDHGLYKLTIQNVIKKEFQFQQGSTIVFGGDPYNASLNMKALYTVNGVPLSDLKLGRSFSSNNVRVDCMMNISGTPFSPKVDFDLDLPTVNSDAKQMVKTIINGEEEMNQQVVYLLSVGRFYIQNNNDAANEGSQQSQTSLAMQSLLSGTISQQINSLLGSLVKNNNWSFGANISTGDEGFNNAEYEGLLQGRLLNNRLLFNGQFGYRDNANATTSFIGDFDISYLLFPTGNLAIKVYNQTNDRYFTKSSLNTQGIGIILKKDFNSLGELFGFNRKRKQQQTTTTETAPSDTKR